MKAYKYLLPIAFFFISVHSVQAAEIDRGFIKENAYETDHYRIEFSDLMMEQEDANHNGLADIIDTIATAAEYSRGILIDDLNYDDPMKSGDKLLIILDDNNQYLSSNALGVTSLLSNGDPYIAIDPWLTDDYLNVTIGHELFHTIQFGYGADFAYTYSGINWAEATATWVEDLEYDSNNDYVNYLSDFFDYPDYSVFASIVPSGTLFEYGLNIWPRFLSEYYNNDVIKQIWLAYFDSNVSFDSDLKLYNTVQEVVAAKGDDLNEVFRQFTLWNLDLSNYEENKLYPDVLLLQGETNADYQQISENYAPALYGTNYIYFENSGNNQSFYFHIQKPDGVRFALTLVPYDSDSVNLTRSISVIVEPGETMDEVLELTSLSGKDGVIAVVSPLDTDTSLLDDADYFDAAYLYNFFAEFGTAGKDLSTSIDVTATGETDTSSKEGETASSDKGILLPDELTLSVVTYDENSVAFSWNRLVEKPITNYELHLGTDSENLIQVKRISNAYTSSATVSGLTTGNIYYFQLVGLDSEGKEVGDPSAMIAVTPKTWLFSDLSYVNEYYFEVSVLVDEGIFKGYSDGTFKPNATINRAELLKILVEGQGSTPGSEYNDCFSDVGTEWYAKYVCFAKERDWVSGYGDGTFRPGDTVNKVEALTMLFEVYDVDLETDQSILDLPYNDLNSNAWYTPYVKKASELGILTETPGTNFEADHGRTRGEMAVEFYRYLVTSELIDQ